MTFDYRTVGGQLIVQGDGEPLWNFGLRRDPLEVQLVEAQLALWNGMAGSFYDLAPSYRGFGAGKTVLLHDLAKRVIGGILQAQYQDRGTCVSRGMKRAADYCQLLSINAGAPYQFEYISHAFIYGTCREDAGQLSNQDGAIGAWAAKSAITSGMLRNTDCNDDDNKDALAVQWGARGVPSEFRQKGKLHLVRKAVPIKSFDEARDFICAGLGAITVASMIGYEGQRNSDGIVRRRGQWAHQMCLAPVTEIPLLDGTCQTIRQLAEAGNPVWVYSFEDGRVVPKLATARMTRARVSEGRVRVGLDNGEAIETTLDHRFMRRDGSYVEAQDLAAGDSLMPLYRRDSTAKDCKHRVGYEMVQDPESGKYVFTHLRVNECVRLFGLRFKDGQEQEIDNPGPAMAVVHHRDFNKRNNDPANLAKMLKREHWQLHAGANDPAAMWEARKDPAYCERQRRAARKAMKRLRRDPAFLAKLKAGASANMKRLNADPEFDAKKKKTCGERLKALWKTQAFRDKWEAATGKKLKPLNHKVASVIFLPSETGPVYCLTVEGTENFAVAAGVFVHNCFTGYRSDIDALLQEQSWGPNNPTGPTVLGQPGYSFFTVREDAEAQIREGDTFGISWVNAWTADPEELTWRP